MKLSYGHNHDHRTINIHDDEADDLESEDKFESSFLDESIQPKTNPNKNHLRSVGNCRHRNKNQVLSRDHKRSIIERRSKLMSEQPQFSPDASNLIPKSSKTPSRNKYFSGGANKSRIKSLSPSKYGPEYYLIFKEYERFIERSELPSTNDTKNKCMKFEK